MRVNEARPQRNTPGKIKHVVTQAVRDKQKNKAHHHSCLSALSSLPAVAPWEEPCAKQQQHSEEVGEHGALATHCYDGGEGS